MKADVVFMVAAQDEDIGVILRYLPLSDSLQSVQKTCELFSTGV